MDRESAFVQAISTAALIYTVTKNCSRGDIVGCGCEEQKNKKPVDTIWSGCSEKTDFAEHIAELIFNHGGNNDALDVQRFVELHNIRAGRIVSQMINYRSLIDWLIHLLYLNYRLCETL